MSRIVLDNWTLELVADCLRTIINGNPKYNQEYIGFIEAIILWDEVCYFDNGYQAVWSDIGDEASRIMKKMLTRIDNNIIFEQEIPEGIEGVVERGALEYYLACTRLGCGYLAVQERAEFLSEYLNRNSNPQRLKVIGHFDKKLQASYTEKCKEINQAFHNSTIRFPALFELVQSYSKQPLDYIDIAGQLRDNLKDTKKFREIMDEIEKCDLIKQQKKILKLCADIDKLFEQDVKDRELFTFHWSPKILQEKISVDMKFPTIPFCTGNISLFRRMKNNSDYKNI